MSTGIEPDRAAAPSASELAATLDGLDYAVFALDRAWRFTYANPRGAELVGRPVADLVGRRLRDVLDVPDDVAALCRRAMDGERVSLERAEATPAGRWLETKAFPTPDGIAVQVRDVTLRRQALTELAEHRARLELLTAIAARITAGMSPDEVLATAVERLNEAFPELTAGHVAIDADGVLLLPDARHELGDCPHYLEALRRGETVAVEDLATDPRLGPLGRHLARAGVAATLDVPVRDGGELLGALYFDAPAPRSWSAYERETLAQVAEQIALALQTARADADRRASEERMRAFLGAVPDLIFRHRLDGTFLDYQLPPGGVRSPAQLDEQVGHRITDVLPPHVSDRVLAARDRALATGQLQSFHYRLETAGETHFYEGRLAVTGPDEFIVLSRDVTEAERARERLVAAEERFRTLVEEVPLVMYVAPPSSASPAHYVGPQMEALLGVPAAEWASTPGLFHSLVHADDLADVRAGIAEAGMRGEPYRLEYRMRHRDGRLVWVRDEGSLVYAGGGAVLRGFLLDITAQKAAEAERTRLEEELRQSHKIEAVGRLAGGVAHDFNNLLTAITGYSELVLTRLDDERQRDRVREIKKAADRAAALVRQLLAFSRKQVLQPRHLDLNEIVTGIEAMLQPLIGEHVELVADLEPGIAPVLADPGQIEQVIVNLVVNARDAMPEGGRLTVRTAEVPVDAPPAGLAPGRYVTLAVSDTGVGMDEETRERLFEPFFTTKDVGRGTGLGLATVYGIVAQSGGGLTVTSAPGEGAEIVAYFPAASGAVAVPAPAEAACAEAAPATGTLLLVEDDAGVRLLVEELLSGHGYSVLTAASGEEALALSEAAAFPIDLVLTDVVMPGMDGRRLVVALRERRPEIRVVYMSGYADGAAGVTEPGTTYLAKPFTMDRLARTVRAALEPPDELSPAA